MPQKTRPRRYSWKYDNMKKEWWCKETDEKVSDVMIANVSCYEDIGHIPKSFHVTLRALLAKRQLRPVGCTHENKVETTMFADAKRHYTCPECGWSTPRPPVPKELPAIDDLTKWVAEQEGVVESWKVKAKASAVESKKMNDDIDTLIEEVFNGNRA